MRMLQLSITASNSSGVAGNCIFAARERDVRMDVDERKAWFLDAGLVHREHALGLIGGQRQPRVLWILRCASRQAASSQGGEEVPAPHPPSPNT